jgi:carboxypeptidase C (cathepsin A)
MTEFSVDFRSYMPALSSVVQSGLTTIIWAGDADFNCNWFGNLDVVNALAWSKAAEFKGLEVSNYTVNGTVGGTFKTLDNLSWLRVFEAGHEVMFYSESAALVEK